MCKVLICVAFLIKSFALNAQGVVAEKSVQQNYFNIDLERLKAQEKVNVQQANRLLGSMYDVIHVSNPEYADGLDAYLEIGVQAGYIRKELLELGEDSGYDALLKYKRVWTYDSGIALTLAVATEDLSAGARARWLLHHGEFIENPEQPGEKIFAGWPFSLNQKHLGDSWKDARYITGANSFAICGLAHYITSEKFELLSNRERHAYLKFFRNAFDGILYHIESEGPNEGLVTAGWTVNILRDVDQTDYSYYDLLDKLGYRWPEMIDGYPEPIMRVRAKHVFLEHCIGLLQLLNYTLAHFDQLLGSESSYAYFELNEVRKKLRDSVFDKLYNKEERHFITGRSASGESSSYKAIDNTSWLVLALRLEELTVEQADMLKDSLVYTIKNFTSEFTVNDRKYFGAYYYENGFEDPYVVKSFIHSEVLHIKATCGLICGLLKFVRQYPGGSHDVLFRATTLKLWQSMQYWTHDNGFLYSSHDLQDVYADLESSTSATWYLFAHYYFHKQTMIVNMY